MMTESERLEFLSECESQFAKRYTDQDTEYARITKPDGRLPPPVIPDWPAEKPRFNQNRGHQQNYQVITDLISVTLQLFFLFLKGKILPYS